MKKLQPIALTLILLLPLFLSTTAWGALVASPITGHAGIALTLSDNLGSRLVETATTTTDGTTTTLVATDLASAVDDFYNTFQITITSGAASGEQATILDYDGMTKTITVGAAFSTPILSGVTFRIDRSNIVDTIAFGTLQITTTAHGLTAVKGSLQGNTIVTDANGEYQVTFNAPDLAATTYSIRVGGRTTPFNLTAPVLNTTAGQVGIRLMVSGQYGVPNANLGAIQFDTTEITQTAHGLNIIKGTLDADLKSIITDAVGAYEAAFDLPDHIAGGVSISIHPLVEAGTTTADGSITNDTLIATGLASGVDDFYNTFQLIIASGTASGQRSTIADYDGTTKTITVNPAFSAQILSGVTFRIERIPSQATFTVRGSITDIDPTTVKFGEPITISGKGFDNRDTLTIVIGDQTFTISQGSVNTSGNFSVPVTIGDGKWSTSHNVTVSGNVSGNSVTLANEVVINPSIVLTPTLGSQNTPIQVTGHNFSGRGDVTTDEIVNIDFGTTVNIVEVRHPDFGGNLPGKFVTSFVAGSQTVGGTLTVKARGTISNPDATADFLYSLPSSNRVLELSEASGPPGKVDLVITGAGYPRDTNIGSPLLKATSGTEFNLSIVQSIFGTDQGGAITTDADGKFRVIVRVPLPTDQVPPLPIVAGSYTIFVGEDLSNQANDSQSFSIIPPSDRTMSS